MLCDLVPVNVKEPFAERVAISRCHLTHLSPKALLAMSRQRYRDGVPGQQLFRLRRGRDHGPEFGTCPRAKLAQTIVIHRSYSGGDTAAW